MIGSNMNNKIKLLLVLAAIVCVNAVSYKGFKVYDVVPKTKEDVNVLKKLLEENKYVFWNYAIKTDNVVKIMVAPEKQDEFEKYVASVRIDAKLVVDDVQMLIDAQLQRPVTRSQQEYNWDYYQTLDEIYAWLDKLAEDYPDVVSTFEIGTTIENRPIRGIKIDYKKQERPTIGLLKGALHAREWITPATLTWVVNQFLTSEDTNVRNLAENVVWHVIPVANPDGYVYSFTDDRMWRKNRNRANFTSCAHLGLRDDLSNGIDLNRNFGYLWMTTGASQDPCTQTFAGPTAFSERESVAIANYVYGLQRQGNLVYYLGFHSYTQLILVPYSHVGGADVLSVPNYGDLFEIAVKGAAKLTERHNTPYRVGTSADILYEVSGSGFDWAKGEAGVPIVLLYELRDLGQYGFLLPADQIVPNSEEVLDSLVELDRVTRQIGYYQYQNGGQNIKTSILLLISAIIFVM